MAKILGISAFYHDSAAALIVDGVPLFAAQEERFTRVKHDPAFPLNSINYCLEASGIALDELDHIVFYEKPFLKFERLLETYLSRAPKGFISFQKAMPVWVKEKLFQKDQIIRALKTFSSSPNLIAEKLLFAQHHQSHAASAFFPSPFDEAIILTMDGVGEWATASVCIGRGRSLETIKEIHFPHSLGLLYSAFTSYTGFKVNSGEYKLMGLAPYGEPKYAAKILDHIIDVKPDGSFWLDQSYFNYATGLTMTSRKFHRLFGQKPRKPEGPLEQFHMDIAASVQSVTETIMLAIVGDLADISEIKNLCLAGGVALNCVANGKVLRSGAFENIWVQPAAGDAGGALGAALSAYHTHMDMPRRAPVSDGEDLMSGAYLGPKFTQEQIEQLLSSLGASYEVLADDALYEAAVSRIAMGDAVGWFQGRMEFGPRALGNRSILADPRNPNTQKHLNLKIKYRESFRPFAPSILAEHVSEYFEGIKDSPYMLMVADVQKSKRVETSGSPNELVGLDLLQRQRSIVPAVTHVDYSARVQTVHKATNAKYHALISHFYERTGCPLLVNTSFNVRGEPIVHTPLQAFECFMGTEMETLVLGNCFLQKEKQKPCLKIDYKHQFKPD